jgi:hypothetical protein
MLKRIVSSMSSDFGRRFVFAVLTLSIILSLASAQNVEVKTVDGITVIHNPKTPIQQKGVASTIILKEDLIIGKEQDDPERSFASLSSFSVDDSGNIYVVDGKENKIKIYRGDGSFLRSFGRRGQGPGEFQGASQIVILPDGNQIVTDFLGRRLVFFSAKDEFLRQVSTSGFSIGGIHCDHRGDIYALNVISGPEKRTQELIKFNSNMKPIATLTLFDEERKPGVFKPFSLWIRFDVTHRDELVWAIASKYEINILNSEGKPVKRIVKDFDPIKITGAEKERLIREDKQGLPAGFPSPTYEFPPSLPPIKNMFLDDQDRIFIQTYEKDGRGGLFYEVFDPEGRYISRFSFPEKEEAGVVKKDKLYSMIRDYKEGVLLVKRYSLTWKF